MSCRPFRYPLKSVPVHFGTLGSPPSPFWYYMSLSMTKPTKWPVRPAKTQINLGIRSVWSETSLSAWRNIGYLATHWTHNEDWMPRMTWVFSGRTGHFVGFVMLWLIWSPFRSFSRSGLVCTDPFRFVLANRDFGKSWYPYRLPTISYGMLPRSMLRYSTVPFTAERKVKKKEAETTLDKKTTQAEWIECQNGSGPKGHRAELTRFKLSKWQSITI